jgi:HEAT repeat protein
VRVNNLGEPELPKEILPFLIVALHAKEIQSTSSYQAMALSVVEGKAAIPALVNVILHDDDEHAQGGALAALMLMGARAEPAMEQLRGALEDDSAEVRRRAGKALQEIETAKARQDRPGL